MRSYSFQNVIKLTVLIALAAWLRIADAAAEAPLVSAIRAWVLDKADREGLVAPKADIALTGQQSGHHVCSNPLLDPIEVRSLQRLRFWVSCPGAEAASRRQVVARVTLTADVVTAARDVASGQVLSEADVTIERQELPATGLPISDPEQALGKAAKRPIRAGQPLQARMLEQPIVIRRGEHVTILARAEGVQVTATGQALEPGTAGGMLRVRNISSNKEVRARVIDATTVEALGGPGAP